MSLNIFGYLYSILEVIKMGVLPSVTSRRNILSKKRPNILDQKKIDLFIKTILDSKSPMSMIKTLFYTFGIKLSAKHDSLKVYENLIQKNVTIPSKIQTKLKADLNFIYEKLSEEEKKRFLNYLDPDKQSRRFTSFEVGSIDSIDSLKELYNRLNQQRDLHGKVLCVLKNRDVVVLDGIKHQEMFLIGIVETHHSFVIGQQPLPLMHISRADSLKSSSLVKTESPNPSPTPSQTNRRLVAFMESWSGSSSSSSFSDHFVRDNTN